MRALIDADALVFRMTIAVQEVHPFTGAILGASHDDAWGLIQLRLKEVEECLFEEFGERIDLDLHFSDKTNFRYRVDPNYKSNRKGMDKPILYNDIMEKCIRNYDCTIHTDVEADDTMGLYQDKKGRTTCIVSPDKDMKQIEGYHLNLNKIPDGVELVTADEGYQFFLTQCIAGDPTDGYAGCPTMGMKKSKAWLEKFGYTWDSVVRAYEACMSPKTARLKKPNGKYTTKRLAQHSLGLGEEDALRTARCAFILNDWQYYNLDKQEVKLWQPNGQQ